MLVWREGVVLFEIGSPDPQVHKTRNSSRFRVSITAMSGECVAKTKITMKISETVTVLADKFINYDATSLRTFGETPENSYICLAGGAIPRRHIEWKAFLGFIPLMNLDNSAAQGASVQTFTRVYMLR